MKTHETLESNSCQKKTINTVEGGFVCRVCEKGKNKPENEEAASKNKK